MVASPRKRLLLLILLLNVLSFPSVLWGESASSLTREEENYTTNELVLVFNGLISFYQRFISSQDGPNCVFTPSCSHYMEESLSEDGVIGFICGVDRLTRCHSMNVVNNPLYNLNSQGKLIDPVGTIELDRLPLQEDNQ